MALKIENERIIGTIDNLDKKLEGKLPIDRLELIELVSSWGRMDLFLTTKYKEIYFLKVDGWIYTYIQIIIFFLT